MNDLLQTGSDWLEAQRHAHAAHEVTYARGGDSVALDATVGATSFEVETDHGIETWEARDFLVRAADLVLVGTGLKPVPPERGDRITENVGTGLKPVLLVFEVMAPAGQPPWRWSDPNRKTIRVHTKCVA